MQAVSDRNRRRADFAPARHYSKRGDVRVGAQPHEGWLVVLSDAEHDQTVYVMEQNVEGAGMLLRRRGADEKASQERPQRAGESCAHCPSISDTVQTSVRIFTPW